MHHKKHQNAPQNDALGLQNEVLGLPREPLELGGRLWITFYGFWVNLGSNLGSILRLFWHHFCILFASIFRPRFGRCFGSKMVPKWSPNGDQNVFFLDPGARRRAQRRKCDFDDSPTRNHCFYILKGIDLD